MSDGEERSIWDKSNPEGVYPALERLEARLGLPKKLSEGFLNEDDWSFIIKLHALFEAAVTALLVKEIGNQQLEPILWRLPMSDDEVGRVRIGRALGLMSDEDAKFIRRLSNLRNIVAHRVENVNFDLRSHVRNMDANQRKSFVTDVSRFKPEERAGADFANFTKLILSDAPGTAIREPPKRAIGVSSSPRPGYYTPRARPTDTIERLRNNSSAIVRRGAIREDHNECGALGCSKGIRFR